MNCSFLDTLNDDVFDQIVSGDLPNDVRQHLQQCETCRQQVARLHSISALTTQYLYRVACPSPEDLALLVYDPHQLPGEVQAHMQQHLSACAECRAEYEMLSEMMGLPLTLPRVMRLGDTVRTIIARLRPSSAASASAATMALRGAALLPEGRVYETDDILIVLDLEREPNATFSLSGFLSAKDDSDISFEGLTVHLRTNGHIAQTTTIDEFDTFVFSGVHPGTYHLEIEYADALILIETVEVA